MTNAELWNRFSQSYFMKTEFFYSMFKRFFIDKPGGFGPKNDADT
jgi:hypothetical protein